MTNDRDAKAVAPGAVPGKTLLQLDGLTKVFETEEVETHALSNIQLTIRQNEWVAIVGPSGSGKSTLLAVLGLLDTATRGSYLLDGRSVLELSPTDRAKVRNQHIGFIFQSFNLIGDLTVFENVELPLTYRGLPAQERKQRVERALERVGMAHRARHLPGQLSGGQQQRVAVARAVAGDPLILLADEPTGNLDSKNGEAVMQLLSDLHKAGSTICMVTHDPAHARIATRTVSLFDGRVVQDEQLR
ncbi:ABC transporter ATP-binding protein [Corallococcus sp. NCSPR001]|uniref:ABC transporter ATP-binding protein n=1 Tax=Corallococcus sp. NCSPR001 TaxID=2813576 RepID=UPI001A8CC96A|nr:MULTISPECIES: ABC transporter ATP-binding protein [unclassified Corallococcus]MBN9681166.1 ABC transporter ATP-binding protein [Corallococcus sp. NCSPR001]WAS87253.1 ABC transporter ATP-binding protein [Corallococcus sp. NCRR]